MRAIARFIWLLPFLFLFFSGMDGNAQETDERSQLEKQQKDLSAKVELLKREQDLLLFRKEFYRSDSKYLILNIPARTGELRYKNRLLKSFSFTPSSKTRFQKCEPHGVCTAQPWCFRSASSENRLKYF